MLVAARVTLSGSLSRPAGGSGAREQFKATESFLSTPRVPWAPLTLLGAVTQGSGASAGSAPQDRVLPRGRDSERRERNSMQSREVSAAPRARSRRPRGEPARAPAPAAPPARPAAPPGGRSLLPPNAPAFATGGCELDPPVLPVRFGPDLPRSARVSGGAAPAVAGGRFRSSTPIPAKGAGGSDGLCSGCRRWVPPPFVGAPSEQPFRCPGSVSIAVWTERAGERCDTGLQLPPAAFREQELATGCWEPPSGSACARAPAGFRQAPSAVCWRSGSRRPPAQPRGGSARVVEQGWKGSREPPGSSRPLRQVRAQARCCRTGAPRRGMLQAQGPPRGDSALMR